MSDARDLQRWFERSADALPSDAFTRELAAKLRRRERALRWQRHAGLLLLAFSFWLLLPVLAAPLEALAALPLLVAEAGGARWPWMVLGALALAAWLLKRARGMGYLRRG